METEVFKRRRELFRRCRDFVRIYDVVSFCLAANLLNHVWNVDWVGIERKLAQAFLARFPDWLNLEPHLWFTGLYFLTLISAALVVLFSGRRWPRCLLFASSCLAVATPMLVIPGELMPGPDIRYLGWVWTNFILIFLPVRTASRRGSQHFIYVLWGAVASLLLFYSIAGISKITSLVEGVLTLPASSFIPYYPSCTLARVYQTTPGQSQLSLFLMNHEYLNFAAFVAVILLEVACFPLAFFPRWHRWLGVALVLFHAATVILVRMNFYPLYTIVAIMLIYSPFAPVRGDQFNSSI